MSGVAQPSATDTPWIAFRPGVMDDEARMVGSKCPSCHARFFPLRQVCSRCLTADLETFPLSDTGTLYTYTVVRQAAPGFEVPYVLGYIDLPEGVRLLGQVAGIEPEAVRLGMRLHLHVEPFGEDEAGRTVLGFRFRPEGRHDD